MKDVAPALELGYWCYESSGLRVRSLVSDSERASQGHWVGYCCIHTIHGDRVNNRLSFSGCEFRTRVMKQVVHGSLFWVGFSVYAVSIACQLRLSGRHTGREFMHHIALDIREVAP